MAQSGHEYWRERTDRALDFDGMTPDAEAILMQRDHDIGSVDRPTLDWVRRKVQSYDAPSVLDVGCGFGRWARVLDGTYSTYLGVDPVERRIERANRDYPGRSVSFRTVDPGGDWTLGRGFDVILFVAVLQHVPTTTAQALLRSALSHLNDGGRVLLAEWGFVGAPEGPPVWLQAPADTMVKKDFDDIRAATPGYSWSGVNGRWEVYR